MSTTRRRPEASISRRSRTLFEDRRARYIDDTLTINITETNSASTKWSTKIQSLEQHRCLGRPDHRAAGKSFQGMELAGSSSSNLDGKGEAAANNVFKRHDHGDRDRSARQRQSARFRRKTGGDRHGTEYIRVSGIVNPYFINAANSISSSQLADARKIQGRKRRSAGHQAMALAGQLLPQRAAVLRFRESPHAFDPQQNPAPLGHSRGNFACAALPLASAPAWADGSRTWRCPGRRTNQLVGYGLVVGLDGTGDQATRDAVLPACSSACAAARHHVADDAVVPQLKNVAAVMVTANLPPFARIEAADRRHRVLDG